MLDLSSVVLGVLNLQAADLLDKLQASQRLKNAIVTRKIAELEEAIAGVKKGSWERDLSGPMLEANDLLVKVNMWVVVSWCYYGISVGTTVFV